MWIKKYETFGEIGLKSKKGNSLLDDKGYERSSMIITSNREFSPWNEVFHDDQMTATLLDQLTHKAYLFPMNGDSYRLKETYSS